MEIFKDQVKDYIKRNKIYIVIFWTYSILMTSVMAGLQAEVPFANLHNYFENNYILITIMLFQSEIMILALIKNSYPKSKMLKHNIKSYFISNVIISVIFSIITFILIASIFYGRIFLSSDLSAYESIYFFGLEITRFDAVTTLKIISYPLSVLLAITALSNLLCLIPELWTKICLALIVAFFIFSLWKKTFAVTTVTSIFEMNNSSYLITIGVSIIAILIFIVEWVIMQKNYTIRDLIQENGYSQ